MDDAEKSWGTAESGLTNEQVAQILHARLLRWEFDQRSDEENVLFAHKLVYEVADVFHDPLSSEFKGKDLPRFLKPVYMTPWSPYDFEKQRHVLIECYPDNMYILIRKREEHQHGPVPEKLHEITEDSSTFDEALIRINQLKDNDPEFAEAIANFNRPIIDDAVQIYLDGGFRNGNLKVLVEPSNITLSVYGDRDETDELSNFLRIYHNKPSILAELAASLAVLCVQHHQWPKSNVSDSSRLSDADKNFLSRFGVS